MKLIIGAGERLTGGFVHHDVQALPGIDIVCEFFDLPEHVKAASCEEIHMTHVLEHFPMARVGEVLALVYSLLTDGGKFYIEVPNFKWHAEMILKDPLDRQIVEYAYGGQHNEWDYHYNGFTPEILSLDLRNAGFRDIEMDPASSIMCWAKR